LIEEIKKKARTSVGFSAKMKLSNILSMHTQWFTLDNSDIEISNNSQYATLFVGKDTESLTSAIKFIHKTPQVESNILIKAILFDESEFDMTGDLVIETGASGVDSYLKIDVLLMSDRARARAIPSLEITEDSVKGGHGATIGPVNPEQLFYLQSRGLQKEDAERILAEGFVQELVEMFEELPEELKAELCKL
jgi:Fe-S cluster assembly scaffold protein SufB